MQSGHILQHFGEHPATRTLNKPFWDVKLVTCYLYFWKLWSKYPCILMYPFHPSEPWLLIIERSEPKDCQCRSLPVLGCVQEKLIEWTNSKLTMLNSIWSLSNAAGKEVDSWYTQFKKVGAPHIIITLRPSILYPCRVMWQLMTSSLAGNRFLRHEQKSGYPNIHAKFAIEISIFNQTISHMDCHRPYPLQIFKWQLLMKSDRTEENGRFKICEN